jgi:hypothetical protein
MNSPVKPAVTAMELTRFVLFIGPCSSVFDYTTFFMMLYMFNCWDISTPGGCFTANGSEQKGAAARITDR